MVDWLNKVKSWFKRQKKPIDIGQIKHVLSTHDDGVCDHALWNGVQSGTILSWIAPLGTNQIEVL